MLKCQLKIYNGSSKNSVQNILTGLSVLDFTYPQCKDCYVHKGFYAAFLAIKDLLAHHLKETSKNHPNAPIYLQGIVWEELQLPWQQQSFQKIINWEQSTLLGSLESETNLNITAYRIAHFHDIVPSIKAAISWILKQQKNGFLLRYNLYLNLNQTKIKINLESLYLKMRAYIFFLVLIVSSTASQYQPSISRQLGIYSVIVYQPESTIINWTCQYCELTQRLTDITYIKVDSQHLLGMLAYSTKLQAIVVVFRGTSSKSKENIMTDIQIEDTSYPNCQGCKVHKGIYKAFRKLKNLMINALQTYTKKYPTAQIYITGHSLGGALASFAAAELANEDTYDLGSVYTYGKPRVGNRKFADWFNNLLDGYRIVHYHDIIPSLPPKKSIAGLASKVTSKLSKIKLPKVKVSSLFGHYTARSHDLSVQTHQSLLNFEYYHEGILIWYSANMKTYQVCDGEHDECFKRIKIYNPYDHFKKYYVAVPSSNNPVNHFKQTHMNRQRTLSMHD